MYVRAWTALLREWCKLGRRDAVVPISSRGRCRYSATATRLVLNEFQCCSGESGHRPPVWCLQPRWCRNGVSWKCNRSLRGLSGNQPVESASHSVKQQASLYPNSSAWCPGMLVCWLQSDGLAGAVEEIPPPCGCRTVGAVRLHSPVHQCSPAA